jgi:hypothetical protein
MAGLIWEGSFWVFFWVTCILGGGAAVLTGRASALTWRQYSHLALYMVILGVAVRFFHYALFDGSFFFRVVDRTFIPTVGIYYYVVDLIVLLALAWIGFRATRSRQIPTQYGWLYERAGPIAWRRRGTTETPADRPETP